MGRNASCSSSWRGSPGSERRRPSFQSDLPEYESLDSQVLGVSIDVPDAQQAFAEKLGLTYPFLSDFSRGTVKTYGVIVDDLNPAYFRMARRAYVVLDTQGRGATRG